MKYSICLIALLYLIGCTGVASVEVGFNDANVSKATYGDIAFNVLVIEFESDTIWAGNTYVSVPLLDDTLFTSATNGTVEVDPGSYQDMRVTAESLRYVMGATDTMLLDGVFSFTAQAFTPLQLDANEELRLVIDMVSENWFDPVMKEIKPGSTPFAGAGLRIDY